MGEAAPALLSTFTRGEKLFEMTNHLGNVLATLTDRKLQHSTDSTNRDYYEPDILTATDYYPFGMVMPGRGVALAATACHEEWQDATEIVASSDLNAGAIQNGTEINHNGVRWARMNNATITLSSQAIKIENGGGSGDGVIAVLPAASVFVNTTYVIEFDIVDKSAAISSFNCQAYTNGDAPYKVLTRKTGTGHHAILFTTPVVLPDYIRLRISANIVTPGTYFVVDNFLCRKYNAVTQTTQVATDFNSAAMSGGNVSADGLLWTPLNSSITSLSVTGTTDKNIKVTCTNVDESRLFTEFDLAGGLPYILRFTMAQDSAHKRLGMRLHARTGGAWALTESQGLIYLGSGNYMLNFTHPAGADAIRVEFLRSNNGQTYDGYNTPYSIDNFSIARVDTSSKRKVTVCDPPPAGENKEGLYRYGFNGQETSTEINADGNSYTAEFWEYDARLGRRWNRDPKPTVGVSQYAAFFNNPIWLSDRLGDSSIVDNRGYILHYDAKDKDLRVFMQSGKQQTLIGELGKSIDANGWLGNLLQDNSVYADVLLDPLLFGDNFKTRVKQDGVWDYKYRSSANQNKETQKLPYHILGIAFQRKDKDRDGGIGDLSETWFKFDGKTGRAEDMNNLHFGVVAKAFGFFLFTEDVLLKTAGSIEQNKWKEDYANGKRPTPQVPASWRPTIQVTKTYTIEHGIQVRETESILLPPYGDNPTDHKWLKIGFEYFKAHKRGLVGGIFK